MPCPSKEVSSEQRVQISDLLELHSFTAGVQFQPRNKAELVAAVAASTQGPRSLRALGTNYSLSDAAVADDVVDTSSLQMHLSQPYLAGTAPLDPSRLRDGGSDFLATVGAADRHFVHVEAGIKVRVLLADLHGCGLALPTMGTGGGQSLAGALSTGTHGADFEVPPLVDWIRAVHLVGAGGQEWWITPEASIFADERVSTLPDWCDDARIVANNDAFDAVRVGVGRMGVIYSLIMEVVPAYGLLEVYFQQPWSDIRLQLGTSMITAGSRAGVFELPLVDLASGSAWPPSPVPASWFGAEVRKRTMIKYRTATPEPSAASRMEYVGGGPAPFLEPVEARLEAQLFNDMLSRLGVGPLASMLKGSPPKPLHHVNIVVPLAYEYPERCYVIRRWRVPPDFPKILQLPSPAQPDEIQGVVENEQNHRKPTALVGPLQRLLEPDVGVFGGKWLPELLAHLGVSAAVRIREFRYKDVPRIAADSEQAGATIGEALFLILYKLATDPILSPASTNAVAGAVNGLIGGDTIAKLLRCGLATEILDTHLYKLDGSQSGNSAEFFFDASGTEHLKFIDDIINLSHLHAPVFGYMGIRFTPSSTALIAMQRFPLTVSVEVATARSRLEDVYAAFWDDVHGTANSLGAIAHWGQEFRQSAGDIAAHYGERLVTWRRMMAELSIDGPSTFSTRFSRDKGLEPTEATGIFDDDDDDAIELFLVALEGASD